MTREPAITAPAPGAEATAALAIIQDEHRSLSAMLRSLQFMARDIGAGRAEADFDLLRAMVYYVDAYPERLHHPKEETFLFDPLERCGDNATRLLLASLRTEHAAGDEAIRNLERKLLAFEHGGRRDEFVAAAELYVDNYAAHMHKEEHDLLPLAARWLSAADWSAAHRAFSLNEDPLSGITGADFKRLFSRIVNLAPPPIGVGPLFPRRSQERG
jgi:hemerythrin-like domain-containing protein